MNIRDHITLVENYNDDVPMDTTMSDPSGGQEQYVYDKEKERELNKKLNLLPPKEEQIYRLVNGIGPGVYPKSFREIAKEIGMDRSTIHNIYHGAKRKLDVLMAEKPEKTEVFWFNVMSRDKVIGDDADVLIDHVSKNVSPDKRSEKLHRYLKTDNTDMAIWSLYSEGWVHVKTGEVIRVAAQHRKYAAMFFRLFGKYKRARLQGLNGTMFYLNERDLDDLRKNGQKFKFTNTMRSPDNLTKV